MNHNEIVCVEGLRDYIKSIELNTLEVRITAKPSNISRVYGPRYVIPRFNLNSVEMKLSDRKISEEVKKKKIASCYYYSRRTAIIFSIDWKDKLHSSS